jgi:hypothetical protein
MKTLILTCSLFLLCCNQKPEPKIEIWGNDSTGFSVKTLDKSGQEYYKWSDLASDTTSMRLSAEAWYNSRKD